MLLNRRQTMSQITQRKQAAILGALVGDAASLGFHWLYDPARIAELGGEQPEFHPPDPADYEGASGYFAADDKEVGDPTHYGAQLEAALRSLSHCAGRWNPFHYQAEFCRAFDRGGSFCGYIDSATAGTLDRVQANNAGVLENALARVDQLSDSQRSFFAKYVLKKAVLLRGDELVEAVAGMARLVYKDDDIGQKASIITRYYDQHRSARNGADDNQLPAVAKLPVVVSALLEEDDFEHQVEVAIRVTNDNEQAVSYGLYAARVLQGVTHGRDLCEALSEALERVEDTEARERLQQGLEADTEDLAALGRKFGPACPLPSAIPVAVALLKDRPDYRSGVRRNILVSGDNAGRATWLGAVLGAVHGLGGEQGIPLDWLARLKRLPAYLNMVERATRPASNERRVSPAVS